MPISKLNRTVMEAAIIGFQQQKAQIDNQIAELRQMLDGNSARITTTPEAPTGKRKRFSAAARKRIAEAQKARWAKYRGESEKPAPEPKPKRKLSVAARAALAANLKKARAAQAAKRASAK